VPAFPDAGGVPAVADFILRVVACRPDYEVRVISLAASAHDPCSLLILDGRTWRRGVATRTGRARGRDYVHVGARFGELEFQRLARRPELSALLRPCDLIQVVAGVPAWATPVLGLDRRVVLQVATLAAVERRARASVERGPKAWWRAAMTQVVARLDRRALQAVDVVMVENPWMLAHARAGTGGTSVRILHGPPGVDTTVFRPLAPADERSGSPYILAVGRFSDPRKNPTMLLEAYARVAAAAQPCPALVLAGADPPGAAFWARADALGLRRRVAFIHDPPADELAKLYRQALCLAFTSDEEGFGVVIIEAMASGIPVVATRCGGPDGIITDGVDGYLVDLADAAAMADRLLRFVTNPQAAKAMGLSGLATVEARFSDGAAGAAFLDLYDELLGERSAPLTP